MQFKDLKTKADIKELFINTYGWENVNDFEFATAIIGNKSFHLLGIAKKEESYIVYCDIGLSSNQKQLEREILLDKTLKNVLFGNVYIFAGNGGKFIDFVKVDKIGKTIKLKRFSINPDNRRNNQLRTTTEQLSKLKLDNNSQITTTLVLNKIDEAFSVDLVAESFYNEYDSIFGKIYTEILKQAKGPNVNVPINNTKKNVTDFVHLFLDRLMFLYFIQKRGCFNGDKDFIYNTYWDTYKSTSDKQDKFYSSWLNSLFFEALSKPDNEYRDNPDIGSLNNVLKKVPYLNGGLFMSNENLDKNGWYIPDILFDNIFNFFQGYNFTVEESTPLDIDIAINPEMLGNIYEHLINISELSEGEDIDKKSKKTTEGHSSGIFYTPKTEIDLMLRRSLVEFLYQKTQLNKDNLYRFIFDEQSEKQIKNPFDKEDSVKLLILLEDIAILDPACGSGHYLIVAAQLIYRLRQTLSDYIGRNIGDKYKIKREIIERNIYGNDVKEWAVEIAKLRLWLDLFVDADQIYLSQQNEPILPNLDFKIRVGDSLIQRLGNTLIPLRAFKSTISKRKQDFHYFIEQKKAVYEGKESPQKVNYLERKLIQNLLSESIFEVQQEIQDIKNKISRTQIDLFRKGFIPKENEKLKKSYNEILVVKEDELKELEKTKKEIDQDSKKELPMIWDIAFAEIFQNKGGFDIVIANPPYVRQEEITDPYDFYKKTDKANTYKNKLLEQLQLDYSYNLEGRLTEKGFQLVKLNKQSDLYAYFYLKGLKLLNSDGILCYISSNSWLDVEYGTALQDILLKRVPIIAIYDNQVKRSFAHASVNTIIFISKAPLNKDWDNLLKTNEVTFINFKKPFDEISYSEVFIDIENKQGFKMLPEGKRKVTDIAGIHILNHGELYTYGLDPQTREYTGNKWGGKYLRAPEIYWIILEKSKDKLVKLGDIADVRRGFTTGANDFFYLDEEKIKQWGIEEEFLKPIIKSPRECKSILVNPTDLKYKIFICNKSKKELKGTNALKYIEWGESKGFNNRSSCRGRNKWYGINTIKPTIVLPSSYNPIYKLFYNPEHLPIDKVLYGIESKNNLELLTSLVSYWFVLQTEIYGYDLVGGGGLFITVNDLEKLFVFKMGLSGINNSIECSKIRKSIFNECGINPKSEVPIAMQEPHPLQDRVELDKIVFDALELTENERKEVYRAVCQLVWNRISKAKSV